MDDLGSIDARAGAESPRHRWYLVKEAFSPEFVNHVLRRSKVKVGETVLDPFAGSGTVPLCCSARGIEAKGLEVNPFLASVARAKLLRTRPDVVVRYAPAIFRGLGRGWPSALETFSTFSEAGGASKWLFNRTVLRAFEGGWRVTNSIPREARPLFRLALVGAAMDVCNAFKDGKCLRYRRKWADRGFDEQAFGQALERRLGLMREDLETAPLQGKPGTIANADARSSIESTMGAARFRLCITSPPYLNSFDYTDVYRPELFLSKVVKSMEDLRELRLSTLRSHTQVKWEDPTRKDFGPRFGAAFARIVDRKDVLWNQRILLMIRAYFEDMAKVLQQLRSVADHSARVWIVVATSSYAGVEIPVDLILADIATREGWYVDEVQVVRKLRRVSVQQWERLRDCSVEGKPHLRESVVVLRRNPSLE